MQLRLDNNGEDWGLYLAVEGVEESFLLRNYGTDYGELYKPDSMEMGGGRGNGGGFDMDQFQERFENDEFSLPEGTDVPGEGEFSPPEGEEMPAEGGFDRGEGGFGGRGGMGGMPSDMGEPPEDMGGMPDMSEMPEMGEIPDMGEVPEMGEMPEMGGGMGGGMMGGSSDVLLVYTDDDYDSYANIFDNAKTDVSNADKDRLIDALQALGEGGGVSDCVDIESVISYFVAHNFVCNFDSYTGSMIHNYYLYEDGGLLSMLPWDYNLAFGGFMGSSDAEALVNWSIDDPTSDGDTESRPMLAWIFESEEYRSSTTLPLPSSSRASLRAASSSVSLTRLWSSSPPTSSATRPSSARMRSLSWARRLCASSASCGQRASVISSQARM